MLEYSQLHQHLPAHLSDVIEAVEHKTQAPLEIIVNALLATGALALQRQYDVIDPDGIRKPLSLNILTIADSGERKTTVDKCFSKPFFEHEAQQKERAHQSRVESEFQQIRFEEARKIIRSQIRESIENGDEDHQTLQKYKDLQALKPPPERLTKIVYQDVTVPALIDGLAHNNPSAALMSSEAGSILAGNATEDLPLLNQLWDGEAISVKRKRPQTDINLTDARLTVSLMTQYEPFKKFMNARKGYAKEVGFLARCLFSYPVSRQGYRTSSLDPRNAHYYEHVIAAHQRTLLDFYRSTEPSTTIRYESDTWHDYHAIKNHIEIDLRPGGRLFEHRGYGSKYCNNLSRIAAIIAALSYKTTIDRASLMAAQYLMTHYLDEYLNLSFRVSIPEQTFIDTNIIRNIILDLCSRTAANCFKQDQLEREILNLLEKSRKRTKGAIDLLLKTGFMSLHHFNGEVFYWVNVPHLVNSSQNLGLVYYDFKFGQTIQLTPNYLRAHLETIESRRPNML